MEIPQVLEIVHKLANGQNPQTRTAVTGNCLLRHPQSIRALNRAVGALESQHKHERRRSRPANAGKGWSAQEDQGVCDELRSGISFEEIARLHCRTPGSIVARLIQLRKISGVWGRRTA
jgi:hypothetical protein